MVMVLQKRFYQLDTLQLTQEKEKSSMAQCSTGWFKIVFLECNVINTDDTIAVIFPRWKAQICEKSHAINAVNRVKSDTDGGFDTWNNDQA